MVPCLDCGAPARKKRCTKCRVEFTKYETEMRRLAGIAKRRLVKERGKVCSICGKKAESITLHHIERIADGGTNEVDNLQLVCTSCHDEIHREDAVNDNKR